MAKTCLHDGCRSQVFAGGYCKFHQHLTEKSINRLKKNREGVHKGSFKQAVKKQNVAIEKRVRQATPKPKTLKTLKLVQRCDYLFSRYIRQLAADHNGVVKCYTCDKGIHWRMAEAGHYISRMFYAFRFSEFNTRTQCHECNCFKEGNLVPFSIRLIKEDAAKFEEMMNRKNEVFKLTPSFLKELAADLTKKLTENNYEFNPKI